MDKAAIAANRFGLGARAGQHPPADPQHWLLDQIRAFDPRPAALQAVPGRGQLVEELADYQQQAQQERLAARANPAQAMAPGQAALAASSQMEPAMAAPGAPAAMPAMVSPAGGRAAAAAALPPSARQYLQRGIRERYQAMGAARLDAALASETPFVERLVHFWANHFAVSADKLQVIGLAGSLEFEAIRPHVLGRFSDMLLAVEQHPAMLLYLDQVQSIGPNSRAAQLAAKRGQQRGLNENLGREIMELHTLGVHGGYTQADVTEFARALTGWSVAGLARGPAARLLGAGTTGDFLFAPPIHEPGERTIMGKRYGQDGEEQARAVLGDLAAHPATARHIATKLARHFAGDDPPPAMVDRLTQAYHTSSGDLPTVYRALIASPEAWAPQPVKFKAPWEWLVSSLRGLGATTIPPQAAALLLNELGQPSWRPGSPAGWDDIAASWAAPDALLRRVEVAQRIVQTAGNAPGDPRALADTLLPGAVGEATRTAIARAETPQQGLALLLVSPEFMRR